MHAPVSIRPLGADARIALEAGLRWSSGVTARRCQLRRARAAGQPTSAIARTRRCNDQTVRTAMHDFEQRGLAAVQPKSARPHTTPAVLRDRGRARLHQSPRTFGKHTRI